MASPSLPACCGGVSSLPVDVCHNLMLPLIPAVNETPPSPMKPAASTSSNTGETLRTFHVFASHHIIVLSLDAESSAFSSGE